MTLPNLQDYHRPATAEEAIALMQQHGEGAMLVAGGTFVHGLEVRGLLDSVTALIDIGRLGLGGISREGSTIVLGATTTLAAVAAADFTSHEPAFGALRDALTYPPPQIRNAGTIGGSVAAAAPLYDIPAALLALGAVVRTTGPKGRRELPLDGFFRGLFESALAPGEIITGVAIPPAPARTAGAFLKLETNANDLAIVSVASQLTLDAAGRIAAVRIVLGGGVGETYVRATGAEAALAGQQADDKAFAAAAKAVGGDFEPVSDHRGSAAYRRHIAGVYVRRTLTTARERLG